MCFPVTTGLQILRNQEKKINSIERKSISRTSTDHKGFSVQVRGKELIPPSDLLLVDNATLHILHKQSERE